MTNCHSCVSSSGSLLCDFVWNLFGVGVGEAEVETWPKPLILLFGSELVSLQQEAATLPDSAALHYISNDPLQFELRIQYNCQKQMFIFLKVQNWNGKKMT